MDWAFPGRRLYLDGFIGFFCFLGLVKPSFQQVHSFTHAISPTITEELLRVYLRRAIVGVVVAPMDVPSNRAITLGKKHSYELMKLFNLSAINALLASRKSGKYSILKSDSSTGTH